MSSSPPTSCITRYLLGASVVMATGTLGLVWYASDMGPQKSYAMKKKILEARTTAAIVTGVAFSLTALSYVADQANDSVSYANRESTMAMLRDSEPLMPQETNGDF